ncbi:MAG: carbohydrate-binding protein, partial [Acidobacteria bacterium]|nr:carbohydrate-binding protein [Acidobacteriota bacterium]
FYPDTRAAVEADVAAKRLRAAQALKMPAPPTPPPKPKPATPAAADPSAPAPAKPAPPAARAEERPLPEPVPPGRSDVEIAADGTVTARADKATIHGSGAKYENGGGRDNIGFWNDPGTWVSWEVPSARAATYALELVYAADQGNGGEIKVSVGEESVRHTVEVTGGWSRFETKRVGTVRLPRTGPVTIAVSPMRIHGAGVMNLQAVRLVPEK